MKCVSELCEWGTWTRDIRRNISIYGKFQRSRVPTRDSFSRRILKVSTISRVEAQSWKPKIVLRWSTCCTKYKPSLISLEYYCSYMNTDWYKDHFFPNYEYILCKRTLCFIYLKVVSRSSYLTSCIPWFNVIFDPE